VVLVAVELGQGLIGFVQYFTHLPAALVAAHMLGSCLVLLAALAVLWSTRQRRPVRPTPDPVPAAEPAPAAV
jgi:heme a synthase